MTQRIPKARSLRGLKRAFAMILAIANEKGGVGKTTTTLTVGRALVEMGFKVALIGIDPQRDLTSLFAEDMETEFLKFYDATAKTLRRTVKEAAQDADFVLIDCPPALGKEVTIALSLAHSAIVPAQPEALSLQAITRVMETIDFVRDPKRRGGNPRLNWRVLITMFDSRNADAALIEAHLRENLGERVLSGVVNRHPAIASASLEGKSVLETAPTIRPAQVYRGVARDLLKGWKQMEGDSI
jgi:chromosome partitioning protein